MPKDMSSVRYKRLLKIIALLQSRRRVSRDELEEVGQYSFEKKKKGYEQNRTLQNDLDFLRDEGAEIIYDRHLKLYILEHDGAFIVNIKISKGEIEALIAGLKMASQFLPHLNEQAKKFMEQSGHLYT